MIDHHNDPVYKNRKLFWLCFAFAQFSFITTLWLPYLGEEAVYTITSLEMAFNHDWIAPTVYGINYARPPLFNWLIIPVAEVLGWENVLVASRLVTAFSTLFTSLLLLWFTQKIFKNRSFSFFAALIYLSGDVLFRRGWLAYADPLFSLFVFGAVVFLWLAIIENRFLFLIMAMLGLIASFLTKAVTGYIFYAIALVVLYSNSKNRKFLLTSRSLLLHGITISFPFIWNTFISEGAHGTGMIHDVVTKLNLQNLLQYLVKILLYPIDTFLRWLPISGLILYFSFKRPKFLSKVDVQDPDIKRILWIVGLNYLPYWLAPETHVRYLMPLYPWIALLLAYFLWKMGEYKIKVALVWLAAGIIVRYIAGIWVFPYYEHQHRGDYQWAARDILKIVQSRPLYIDDNSATGLSVVAHLDVLRLPAHPLKRPDVNWKEGYLLSLVSDMTNTQLKKEYRFGGQRLYLLCRGESCY